MEDQYQGKEDGGNREESGQDYESRILSNRKDEPGVFWSPLTLSGSTGDYDLAQLLFSGIGHPQPPRCGDTELELIARNGWGAMTPGEVLLLVRRNERTLGELQAERRRLRRVLWQGAITLLGITLAAMTVAWMAHAYGPRGL